MSVPQATTSDIVDGLLFTPDGPVRAVGFMITGQPNILSAANGQQLCTMTSMALVPAGAVPTVVTASATVFLNSLGAATLQDVVRASNYIGNIVTGQPNILTRR